MFYIYKCDRARILGATFGSFFVFALLAVVLPIAGFGQGSLAQVWETVESNSIRSTNKRAIDADKFLVYRLDATGARSVLRDAPVEFSSDAASRTFTFMLPTPDGKLQNLKVVETALLSPEIQREYPNWRYYQAYGIDDPTATARFGFTSLGFHASVYTAKGTVIIDPIQISDQTNYAVFYKNDIQRQRDFHCEFDQSFDRASDLRYSAAPAEEFSHGSQVRTYRLAIATTGEYTLVFGGQTNALAQVTITANRMNGVYRKDFSVGLQLVSGTSLVYIDPATDPYTNALNSAQITLNDTNIDTVLGEANYDVGHLFATSNNGIAQLSSFCTTSKGRGGSGQPNPQGDGFDVDYVAHEIGHQIGANHTFNSDANCGSGSTNARKEPGSGVTIMSYAGICSSTSNLARNSIDIFLGHSQQEAIAFLGGTGGTCGTLSGTNAIPVVTAPPATSIPFNTPFSLTASATDADGNALTYAWEHNTASAGSTSSYPGTTDDDDTNLGTSRILMRPYLPTASGTRTFPSLTYILNNANEAPVTFTGTSATGALCAATCITGEDLPSVARTINYRVTVRDSVGGVADATTDVTFVNTATPFAVTSQNSAITYAGNSTQTVTWNVSGTTAAPINTANVKITFSTDGGQTFPTTLIASTPNDGTETVTIPNTATTTGRIKVEAVGNIFFDVNGASITVTAPPAAGISAPFDYDGDDRTDLSIFRPSVSQWWYNRSSDGTTFAAAFGTTGDKMVPADYDGDGRTDLAVWRPSTFDGVPDFFVLRSSDSTLSGIAWGVVNDTPVIADYDGDGKADFAVWRPTTGDFYVLRSQSGGLRHYNLGVVADKPVVADYDGDGKADFAVFRPSNGTWYIARSIDNVVTINAWGLSTDTPVTADYDGDSRSDIAVFRPSNGTWYIVRSTGGVSYVPFGANGDIPVPGNYDGDDRSDTAVFRPSNNTWYVNRSTAGTLIQTFGTTGDLPTPNAYIP